MVSLWHFQTTILTLQFKKKANGWQIMFELFMYQGRKLVSEHGSAGFKIP